MDAIQYFERQIILWQQKDFKQQSSYLYEKGRGKRPRKADAMTDTEEEILWEKGVLGTTNAQSINLTVFFCVSQHFGTRGCQEHHQFRIEDLEFVTSPTDSAIDYVEWVEGPTKTCHGGLQNNNNNIRLPQRMFATGGKNCPVHFLEILISRRPTPLKKFWTTIFETTQGA